MRCDVGDIRWLGGLNMGAWDCVRLCRLYSSKNSRLSAALDFYRRSRGCFNFMSPCEAAL